MRHESAFSCSETTGTSRTSGRCTQHDSKIDMGLAADCLSAGGLGHSYIDALSEDHAYDLFAGFRWAGSGGRPICPACGGDKTYLIRRRSLRCAKAGCRKEFSVTSGTLFNSRKLSFRQIVKAIHEQAVAKQRLVATHLGIKVDTITKSAHGLRKRLEQLAASGIAPDRRRKGALK